MNHYYLYCVDQNFGPFCLKFCSYFPYNAKLCLNGHEYAKRQLEREGIAYEALDNGIRSCADPKRLQQICDSLSAAKIDALLRKWLGRLPHPYPAADRAAGYRYQLSIWQIELSLTQVLDRPVSGRMFFEQVIRENLELGRPKQIQLILDRSITKATPGPFRTRVITDGVIPSLHIDYKGTRIKAISQRRPSAAHRNHHPQPARLLCRQEPVELAHATQNRFSSQPASAPSAEFESGCNRSPRNAAAASAASSGAGAESLGLALGRSYPTSAVERCAAVRTAPRWVFQPATARRTGSTSGPTGRVLHPGPHELSSAPSPASRLDSAHSQNPPLPSHQLRSSHHLVLHPRLYSSLPARHDSPSSHFGYKFPTAQL